MTERRRRPMPVAASRWPSGLIATLVKRIIEGSLPRTARAVGWAGSVTFHNRTLPSHEAVAMRCPSALNTISLTVPVWPDRGGPVGVGWLGLVTFHSCTLLSADPVARIFPTGLNASKVVALVRVVGKSLGFAGSALFHNRTVSVGSTTPGVMMGPETVARMEPSGLNATRETSMLPGAPGARNEWPMTMGFLGSAKLNSCTLPSAWPTARTLPF